LYAGAASHKKGMKGRRTSIPELQKETRTTIIELGWKRGSEVPPTW
jgi:hypothetical protein